MGIKAFLRLAWLLAAIPLVGCGTYHVNVRHSTLKRPDTTRNGSLVVKQLVDKRDVNDRKHVGVARGGFGNAVAPVEMKNNQGLETLLTSYIVEAVQTAGYKAVEVPVLGIAKVPSLEGDILKFWVDGSWDINHQVSLKLRLRNPEGRIVWEKVVEGQEGNPGLMGWHPPAEKSIKEALDIMLNQAVNEFASEFFAQNVNQSGVQNP